MKITLTEEKIDSIKNSVVDALKVKNIKNRSFAKKKNIYIGLCVAAFPADRFEL